MQQEFAGTLCVPIGVDSSSYMTQLKLDGAGSL